MRLALYTGSGDKLLYKLGNLAIRLREVSAYSHCELVIGGQCYSSSWQDGGVRRKNINLRSGNWDVFDLPEHYDEIYALRYFEDRMGWPYSYRGVARFVLPFVPIKDNEMFCSQIVAGALQLPNADTMHVQALVSTIF